MAATNPAARNAAPRKGRTHPQRMRRPPCAASATGSSAGRRRAERMASLIWFCAVSLGSARVDRNLEVCRRRRTARSNAMMKALLRRPPLRALPSSTLRFRRQCSSTQGSYSTTKEDYESMAANALKDPETFWLDAAERITWVQPPTTALDSSRAPITNGFRTACSIPVSTPWIAT